MQIKFRPKGTTSLSLGYVEFVPNDYNGVDKLPIIIFHHGVGERGDGSEESLKRILNIALPKVLKEGRELNAIVICPQHTTGDIEFDRGNIEASPIKKILDYVQSWPNVDLNRIYVTGLSMGSRAVFKYVFFFPQIIAAAWAVAIKSSFTPNNKAIKGLPVLIESNEGDSPFELTGIVTWLAIVKAKLELKIGSGNSHNSWDKSYNNQENYDWLFSQTKEVIPPPEIPNYTDITNLYDTLVSVLKAVSESLSNVTPQIEKLRERGNIYAKK